MIRKICLISMVFIICLPLLNALNLPARPTRPVNDYAGVIAAQNLDILNQIAEQIQQQSGVAVVVAIFSDLEDEDLEDYTNRLYEKWGIGQKKTDEGILITIFINSHKWRIESGYGAEGMLPDILADQVGQKNLVPPFREGKYSLGIYNTLLDLAKIIGQEKNITINLQNIRTSPDTRRYTYRSVKMNPFTLFIIIILIIIAVSTPIGRRILYILLISSLLGGRRGNYHHDGGFGGGFGGGDSGGFGGFGGGSSGGGGASGSW